MKTWMFALLLLSTHIALASSPTTFAPGERSYLDPALVDTKYLEVKIMEIKGFTGAYLTKMQDASGLLEVVVNSETFKNRVLNFKNSKGQRAFASNNGKSNEEIYAIFMEGREMLQQDTPGEMNFYLKLYNSWWSRVVGWTNGSINTININKKFFAKYKLNEVAGNLGHEWTHKIGFDHASAAEHDSAPYAIGYIIEELAQQVMKGQPLN